MSAIESVANVVVGYGLAVTVQILLFPPILGVAVSLESNLLIGAAFTLVSLARSYALRRVFERFRV